MVRWWFALLDLWSLAMLSSGITHWRIKNFMITPLKLADEELADLRKIAAEHSDCRRWFCVHHDTPLETLYNGSTVEDRIAKILRSKPAEQHATRFRNLRPLIGELPTEVAETLAACNKAAAARDKAWVACDEALAARDKAWVALNKAWVALNKAWVTRDKAWAAYDEAFAAFDKAIAARDKALAAYDEALAARDAEITDLMNIQWPDNTWNGKNIGWK